MLYVLCIGSAGQSSPRFDRNSYTTSISQNAQANSDVLTVHCSYSGTIRYRMNGYSPNLPPFLMIGSESGVISLTMNATNLAVQNISVFLECFDPNNANMRDLITLTVSRIDENEFAPQFTHTDLQVTISESRDYTMDPFVVDVNATDNDMGTFGSVTYGVEGTIPDPFQINSSSGEITLHSSLDFETDDQYIFIVTASNPPIPATGVVRSAELLVTVNVADANDAPPVFTETNYEHFVSETFLPDYPRPAPGFFTVRCTDPDSNQADITYAISPDSSPGPFIVDTAGSFSTTQDLDYETRTSYSFHVMCFDNGSPNLTARALVDIIITSVNEYPPVVGRRPGTIITFETSPIGTLLASANPAAPLSSRYKYSITDQDAGPDGNITYTVDLSNNPDAVNFTVSLINGDVRLREEIDVDTRLTRGTRFEQLLFRITACDRFPPVEGCPNFEIRILVFSVNEFQPTFSQRNYTASLNESTLAGTTVLVATCTDGDIGNGEFSRIEFFTPQSTFSVDSMTGTIITTAALDYETAQGYGFELRCTDNAGNEGRAVVRVEVIPENDNLPNFDQSSYVFEVSRTTPTNRYSIGSVVARDADIGFGGVLQFTIDANGYFDITDDGNIELFSSVFNYSDTSIFFNVHVSDGSNTDSAAVVIRLTGGNLNRPEFVLGSRAVEVSELSPVGTSIISVLCNDTDDGRNGDIRYFILPGSTDSPFRIDSITGEISVASVLVLPLNSSIEEYLLQIRCEDRGVPILSDEAVIFIRIFQDDSSPPEIRNNTIYTFISEDADINNVVVTIEATDLDSERLDFRLEDQSVPGVFIIDPPSGRVTLAAALDREQTSVYQMTVVVTEVQVTPGPERSDNATLVIFVRDVNDNNPTCDTTMLAVTIPETLAVGSSIMQLNCSDPDSGDNGNITFSLSNDFGILAISNRGEITLRNSLNLTNLNTLVVSVVARDQGLPQLETSYQATIFISSINRNVPTFVNLPATIELSEAEPIQEVVFTVQASDPDRGSFGQVTYEIENRQTNGSFSIFSNTGGLFLTRKLNFFEQQVYIINISASDSDFTVIEQLTVRVLDANEFSPECTSLRITATLPENLSPNQMLSQQLNCSDGDLGSNGEIRFNILSGNTGNAFTVHNNGSVITLQSLDFEAIEQYELQIQVSDSGSPPFTLNVTYVVVVQPVNEYSPVFQSNLYNASVQENSEVGGIVLRVHATDQDRATHAHGRVVYTIIGLAIPLFSISNDGLLQVAGTLNREQQDYYRFTVQASDQGQPPLSDFATVEINITDIDDNPPQFSEPLYIASLNRTTASGTPVTMVTCTDPDLGENAAITYSIDGTAENFQFFEIQSSGLIQVRENLPISRTHTFTVVCMGPAPANFSDTAVVSIQVFVDSNITFHPSDNYNTSIPEDTTPVFTILSVNASASSGASLTYTLLNGGSTFSVDERTGSIRLIASLDYETTRSYTLQVQASDNGSPPNIGEALVQTLVENVNDETPQITTSPSTITLPEGLTISPSTIGQYQCSDMDVGTFGEVRFRLMSGNTGRVFALSDSGTLQLVGNLDYETTQSYTLVAVCEDGGIPPRSDLISIPITISPINDNAPQFARESIDITVSEAILLNSGVGPPIQATDADLPPHNSLRYRIISGDRNPQTFAISSTTGQLTLVQTLDYETTPSFTLVIETQDSGGQIAPNFPVLNDTITVNIIVLDFNDNQPRLSQQTYTGTVQEAALIGGQVSLDSTISCSDLDSGSNGDTSLHITSGNSNNSFAIQNTGIITVASSLDFEMERSYLLTIECRDNGVPQLTSQARVIISVTDVNEFGPVFNQSLYRLEISEIASIGSEVGTILAEDRDAGPFGTISYSFSNASGTPFTIDTTTGVITLSGSLDYESQERLYVLEAQATDDSGLEHVALVVVQVLNSDDNLPRFTMSNYFATVPENAPSGESVGQVSCTDADDQADGIPVRYVFLGSSVPFLIEERLGTITVLGTLDLEVTPRYTLTMTCTDSGGNSATASITINLDPFNDNPPVFTGAPYTLGLTENTRVGSSVFQLMATDNDVIRYNDITFNFTYGNEQGRFSIDSSTGVISVSQTIDRESQSAQSQYILGVQAENVIPPSDTSGSQPLNDSTTLTITILDENDNDPVLTPSEVTVFIPESDTLNAIVETFTCFDPDFGENATTNFSITSQNTASSFEIFQNGTLVIAEVLTTNVAVDVTCSDNGVPPRSSTVTAVVLTMSMNDHPPRFPRFSNTLLVFENHPVGQDIMCYTATDMDGPGIPDGTIAYSLRLAYAGDDVSRFGIREDSGCIFPSIALDYDVQIFYRYTIIATDMGQPPLRGTTTLIVVVNDVIRDSPSFVGAPYTRTLSEGAEGGTLIVDSLCTDQDVNDTVSYSIIHSGGLFSIDSETGAIHLNPGQSLDYEVAASHMLTIQCIDSYNLSDTTTVFLTVAPVNEHTPSFGERTVPVPEHSISGTLVTQLVWNDGDSGPDGEVTFNITAGNINNVFHITSDGRILVSGVLDREMLSFYTLQVQIRDLPTNPSEQRSSENHVNITITDINDHVPVFDADPYIFGPLEGNELPGHYVGKVNCSDGDIGTNAAVTYQITGGENLFSVEAGSGNITLSGDLGMREFDNISFFISCVDGGTRPMTGTTRIVVIVEEINRHAPEFTNSSYYVLVPESTPIISDVILTVHADDRDSGVNGQVRYRLQDDIDFQFFIDADSGQLSLLKPLDFETRVEYLLTVEAIDGAQDSFTRMTSSVNVTIEVSGVNEFTPLCLDPIYVTVINKTTTGEIVDLGCVDDDNGPDGELVYSITTGNEMGLFNISNEGRVSVPSPIISDIEQYRLQVTVSDSGTTSRETQVQVVVIYSFDNLASPRFNESMYSLSVSELTEVGYVVASFEATDTDRSLQGIVTYSVSGTDSFRIDPNSGQLFVARPLDWETSTSEVFTIIAQDSDPFFPRSGSATVIVTVQNENDNLPQCDQVFYSVAILTTAQRGDTVLTLNCTDPDQDILTYHDRSPSSSFSVEQLTGRIYLTGRPVPSTTTVLGVLVSDGGGQTTEITVSVQTRFANIEPPVFSRSQYRFDVREDTMLLSVIGSVLATDNDSSSVDLSYSAQDPAQNLFYVNPTTGEVILTAPLDYETVQQHSFTVRVEDGGSYDGTNQLSDSATVVVNVNNTNDNLPQLRNGGIYGATVSENTPVNTNVLNISCSDGDAAPYGTPTTSSTGFLGTPFELVGSGGERAVRVSQALSGSRSYTINITCTDAGGLSTEGQVFIFVPEPEAPAFSQPVYEWTLRENAPTGSLFSEVGATSFDGSDVTYTITDGNDDAIFYINPATGAVSLVITLDYETQRTHGLIIQAVDGANRQSSVLLLVQVLDVNDQVPLTPPSALLQVAQNAPVGFPVGTLQCTDGDSSPNATMLNFTFVPASTLFSVDSYGVVRLEGVLDDTPVHVLPVTCYDLSMPESVSTGVVTIQVDFVNQNAPEFNYTTYVFSIREDVGVLSLVGTVQAFDRDVGSFGEITYTITSGNPDRFFIEAGSGRIGVLTALDRENTDSYLLTVEATDGGLSASDSVRMTGTTMVIIMVEDANDNAPTPDQSSYVQAIITNHTVRTPVLSVNCSDPDLGDSGRVTYSLNPDTEQFVIQADGTILLAREQSDQAVYNFDVVCSDNGVPSLSVSALVTVLVDTVEFRAPVFDTETYNVTISEADPILSTILQVHATPSDSTIQVVYSIVGGNDRNHFHVNPTTGDITIISRLDASQQQQYILTIQASNTGRSALSSLATVTITVTDINDHAPSFQSAFYSAIINESAGLLSPVIQVQCTDPDVDTQISYRISGGLTSPVFNITQEGLVAVAGEIDYETVNLYTLEVMCSDGADPPRFGQTTIRIEILPLNEFIPSFTQTVYNFTAIENTFGARIGSVAATDDDAGSQGRITYLLQDPGNFSVVFVEPSSGDILVATNLDYETQNFWNLTVIARDGAGAESYATLQITVSNVNDVSPIITPPTTITTVPFDSPVGYPIQTYFCTDADGSNTTISILNGNSMRYFQLNTFNQLVWTGIAGDRMSDAVVSLTLRCQDNSAPTQQALAYIAITIRVGDAISPTFSADLYTTAVSENTAIGSSVLVVTATGSGDVSYDLFNLPPNFPFGINNTTGVISVTNSLNREMIQLFVFPVRATDTVSGTIGLALIEITIEDLNDNSPQIQPSLHSIRIPENLPVLTQVASFACSDADTGSNGEISFQLTNGNELNTYSIGSQSGIIQLNQSLDFETTESYNITVTCLDGGGLSATATLLVAVTGINEYPPVFVNDTYSFVVLESASAGSLIGTAVAFDFDAGVDGELRYEIISGSGVGFFSIDSIGRIYTTTRPINTTAQTVLSIIVRAIDGGMLGSDALVTVTVKDVNEAPIFSGTGSYFAVTATNQPVGTSILNFVCFDTDVGENALLYLEIASNPSNLDIFLQTGGNRSAVVASIVTNSTLSAGSYELSLRCSDRGTPPLHTNTSITVRVEGTNTPPVFTHGVFGISVPENIPTGTLLTTVNATDSETGVSYAITGGNGLGTFSINTTTGDIPLVLPLDYETTTTYVITVTAFDESFFNRLSASVEISIFVSNINDISPVLNPAGIQVITVGENEVSGYTAKTYTCNDPDGTSVSFSISPPHDSSVSPFQLVQMGNTGNVQLLGSVDFEVNSRYNLMVTCTDMPIGGEVTRHEISSDLIIHITPVNNYPPVFVSPQIFQVLEDISFGEVIARVEAVDPDGRGQITYSSSSYTDIFRVDSLSGNVTLIGQLDYETQTTYTLVMVASDNDNEQGLVTPLTNMTTLTIAVIDVNDNRPTCAFGLTSAILRTGTYGYVFLVQLQCSDRDEGENALLTYSFVNGTLPSIPRGNFLLNATSGELGFAGNITAADTIVLDITVSDSGSIPLSTRVTVSVQVQSSNLTRPQFDPSIFNVTISENTPSQTTVLNGTVLQGALSNPSGAIISFVLHANPMYGNTFIIDSTSGNVVLSSGGLLDYDMGLREYSLIVEATVGSDRAIAVVSITLTDYNDNAPRFVSAVYTGSVLENQAVGTSVLQVQAIDIDSGIRSEFRYSVQGSGDFVVNPNNGEVTTLRTFDREIAPRYSFTVLATDLGTPAQTGSTAVTITIGDENDNPPQFASSIYIINIDNLTPAGAQIATLQVDDEDITGSFTFRIAADNDPQVRMLFIVESLDATSGIGILRRSTMPIPNDHAAFYNFTVEVNDEIETDTTTIVIYISSVASTTTRFTENVPSESFNCQQFLLLQGFNITSSATYTITDGDPQNEFIVLSNGILTTRNVLDRENIPQYRLTINVVDDSTSENVNLYITVVVGDQNDFVPVFTNLPYIFTVPEGSYNEDLLIGALTATDIDQPNTGASTIQYNIVGSSSLFYVNPQNGSFFVRSGSSFDRETQDEYSLLVSARDFGEVPRSLVAYEDVLVRIEDANDNPPEFVPFDVIEFRVQILDPSVPAGTPLDMITTVLPRGIESSVSAFEYMDRDITSRIISTLRVVVGPEPSKYQLSDINGNPNRQILVTTANISEADSGTVLQIVLQDELVEQNPTVKNVTIIVSNASATTPSADPTTGATVSSVTPSTERPTNFFQTEIGIAVIVVICVLILALLFFLCCLICYCYLRIRREKDPLRNRYVTCFCMITVIPVGRCNTNDWKTVMQQ